MPSHWNRSIDYLCKSANQWTGFYMIKTLAFNELTKNCLANKQKSRRRYYAQKVFLKISQNLLENTCSGVFFTNVTDFQPATSLKKRLPCYWGFPVNFTKFLRAPILKNIFKRLLLNKITWNITKQQNTILVSSEVFTLYINCLIKSSDTFALSVIYYRKKEQVIFWKLPRKYLRRSAA